MSAAEHVYWRVSPRVWDEQWSEDARVLWLYLLTNRHRIAEGLYRLPKGYIESDLGWSVQRLAKPFGELLADGCVRYDETASVVLIVGALAYQAPDNPNCQKAALRKLAEVPSTPLLAELVASAARLCPAFAERLRERFAERLGEWLAYSPSPTPSPTPAPAPENLLSAPPAPTFAVPFDDFWSIYPDRTKAKEARRRWASLSNVSRAKAVAAAVIVAEAVSCGRVELRYVPGGAVFLNERWSEWLDGIPARYGRRRPGFSDFERIAREAELAGELAAGAAPLQIGGPQ
jgi:hypothetical protein